MQLGPTGWLLALIEQAVRDRAEAGRTPPPSLASGRRERERLRTLAHLRGLAQRALGAQERIRPARPADVEELLVLFALHAGCVEAAEALDRSRQVGGAAPGPDAQRLIETALASRVRFSSLLWPAVA